MPRRDHSAVGNATAAAAIAEDGDAAHENAFSQGRELAAVADAAGKAANVLETSIAALLTEMAPYW